MSSELIRILAIDTSLKGVSMGVIEESESGKKMLGSRFCFDPVGSSAFVATGLQELLAELKLDLADLTEVIVSLGPGSFTGIKVGLAFCQGLRFAQPDLVISGVSSLRAWAQTKVGWERLVFLKATKLAGYAVWFDGVSEAHTLSVRIDGKNLILHDEQGRPWMKDLAMARFELLGPWGEIRLALSERADVEEAAIDSEAICILQAMVNMRRKLRTDQSMRLDPLYLRPSAPEEKIHESR